MVESEVSRGWSVALDEEPRRAVAASAVNVIFGTDGNDVLTVRGARSAGRWPDQGRRRDRRPPR
ncbi:MAG: hypothetical protein KatS3mg117_1976 [Geminicoccaceae bacterium]|nr:MAG: hypothetical protein KatS3mg117_1976 [Geminicoccaceae bacterium]